MKQSVQLREYDNSWYSPGRSFTCRALWLFIGLPLFRCALLPSSRLRVSLLRIFGAKIGRGVVIHSGVRVKYPWHFEVGDHSWIGESVWIDNLTMVRLGDNVCLSQGCYICTGNHNWSDRTFGLMVRPVELANGSWAGARSSLMPGVVLGEGAVASAGSVVLRSIPAWEIHTGNPASFSRDRSLAERVADIRNLQAVR